MYGTTMSMEVLEQPREAELSCVKKTLRADRNRLGTSRWASTVAWEPARTVGTLREFFKAPKNAD